MSQTQIAKALGISQPAVAQRVKRGMPTDSIGAAKQWSDSHVSQRRGKRASQALGPVGIVPPAKTCDELAITDQLRQIAVAAFRNAQTVQDLSAASRTVKDTEEAHETRKRDLVKSEQEAQNLMHRDQVQSVIAEEVGKLRSLLDAMPAAVAMSCNPHDPELAQAAVSDYLEQVYSTLSNTSHALDTR